MNRNQSFRLDRVGVVDVTGEDRDAIVHNLTTNEIKSLAVDEGCETFVTDVRGKTIAHVMLYRLDDRLRLIGAFGASPQIVSHVDRYTIREDASGEIRDEAYAATVLTAATAADVLDDFPPSDRPTRKRISLDESAVDAYRLPWIGDDSVLLLAESDDADAITAFLQREGVDFAGENDFHTTRIFAGFPWFGLDLDDANLPQEADRDRQTISFTKGCYLGQETVARLDALGQVQKKLVSWKIDSEPDSSRTGGIRAGTTLDADGKTVGRLTSVASLDDGTIIAIGFARRSHFDVGSVAKGTDEVSGDVFTAIVTDCG